MRLGVGCVPSAPRVAGPRRSLIQLPEGRDHDTFTLLPPRLPVQAQAPSLCQQSPVTLFVPVTKPTISLLLLSSSSKDTSPRAWGSSSGLPGPCCLPLVPPPSTSGPQNFPASSNSFNREPLAQEPGGEEARGCSSHLRQALACPAAPQGQPPHAPPS